MPKRLLLALLLCLPEWSAPPVAAGELVVVVNAGSGVTHLNRADVVNLFMGRYRELPSGVTARPIDQPATREGRALFYRKLVGKELDEINAYWARLYFSGKTSPPRQAQRYNEVIEWVASHEGGLGYIDSDDVDGRLKVVLELH